MSLKRANRRTIGLAGIGSVLAGAILMAGGFTSPAGASDVTPVDFAANDNPTCDDVLDTAGTVYEFKIDAAPQNQAYPVSEGQSGITGGGTVTISNAGVVGGVYLFDFASTIAWDAVIVKQGDGATVYYYSPERTSDTGLHPSLENEEPTGGISHVTFCRDSIVTTTTESTTTTTQATTSTTQATTTTAQQTAATVLGAVVQQPAAQAAAQTLPVTGDNDLTMAMLGLGLILVGAGAVLFSRGHATA